MDKKKMVKKVIFSLLVLVFAVSVISAYTTDIQIKTIPNHEVQLTILDSSTSSFVALERFKGFADEYGDINFTYISDEYSFDLIVYIKKDGEKIMPPKKLREDFIAGNPIYLELAPSNFEFIYRPNETENETIEDINVTEELNESVDSINSTEILLEEETEEGKASLITGFVIGEGGVLKSKVFYYVLGFILIAFITVLLVQKKDLLGKKGNKKSSSDIKVKKWSEVQAEKKSENNEKKDYSKVLEDAEKKLKEAQEEINKLKNHEKVEKAREKLIEDQKELMRLTREESEKDNSSQ